MGPAGFRSLTAQYDLLPAGARVLCAVSGGAAGVDACAREYAQRHGLKLTEYLPEYARYGRAAPLKRNITIIENADLVLAFWDGTSRGTKYVIDNCKKCKVPVRVYVLDKQGKTDETHG